MIITPTAIEGVAHLDIDPHRDERGFFARSYCPQELADAGYDFNLSQANVSYNARKGTLRGLHYQAAPTPDPKIVRCERGSIWDVALDLRPHSKTYLQWTGAELSEANGRAQIIPAGCAHGFISLEDDSQVLYLMGAAYVADLARGVRWNDPAFSIDWPLMPEVIGDRDANYPNFEVT